MEHYPIHQMPNALIQKYFKALPKLPKKLSVRGTFPDEDHVVFLTVVGSRKYSQYGEEACRKLIEGLRGYPIAIVSGLAQGIDGIAHQAALDAGLTAVAFPGSGLAEKSLYPKYNIELSKKILASDGCLVSEYPDHVLGNVWTFPERNRLMAGLSRATLIIEGEHKSGSRITTRLATEYNRDVLAVPGNITNRGSEAPNELIRLGATPITCSQDILEALGFQVAGQPPLTLFPVCTPDEELVLKKLPSPRSRSELIRELGFPIHKANILLSKMEMKGLIKESGGEIRRY